jgi:hypothetical protein
MRVRHRLVGYDRGTDRMKMHFDIPDGLLPDAKKIAQVGKDDPEAAWSYPLSNVQARSMANLIGAELDPAAAEFFLEAFADPATTGTAA